MPDFSFVVVAVIAFSAPLLRELIPRLFVPAVVLELVLGIVVGPQVLGIAHSSQSGQLFSTVGLAALLFLAGREIDVGRLRGTVVERALACFAPGFLLAVTTKLGLESILAAFTVGVIRGITEERDASAEQKREAVALGIFVPFFFVSSGLDFQLDELFASVGAVIRL